MQKLHTDVTPFKPEVVIVMESWSTDKHRNEQFYIPDYTLFRRDHVQRKVNGPLKRGGGVAIWMKKNLDAHILISSANKDENFEQLWLYFEKDTRPCYIAGIYHPPDPLYQEAIQASLLECMGRVLDEINQTRGNALICVSGTSTKYRI